MKKPIRLNDINLDEELLVEELKKIMKEVAEEALRDSEKVDKQLREHISNEIKKLKKQQNI